MEEVSLLYYKHIPIDCLNIRGFENSMFCDKSAVNEKSDAKQEGSDSERCPTDELSRIPEAKSLYMLLDIIALKNHRGIPKKRMWERLIQNRNRPSGHLDKFTLIIHSKNRGIAGSETQPMVEG